MQCYIVGLVGPEQCGSAGWSNTLRRFLNPSNLLHVAAAGEHKTAGSSFITSRNDHEELIVTFTSRELTEDLQLYAC